MTGERGTALLGTLTIGFAVVLLVGQALVTIGRISSAATTAEETAQYAATWAAHLADLDARRWRHSAFIIIHNTDFSADWIYGHLRSPLMAGLYAADAQDG